MTEDTQRHAEILAHRAAMTYAHGDDNPVRSLNLFSDICEEASRESRKHPGFYELFSSKLDELKHQYKGA